MTLPTAPLSFSAVDDLVFAAVGGGLDALRPTVAYVPGSLGPLLEFWSLATSGNLPGSALGWVSPNGARPFLTALQRGQEQWISSDQRIGFIRAVRRGAYAEEDFTAFLMAAKRAATQVAGFPGNRPGHLVAAMEELESNIHEHSESADTGLVCFRASDGLFEFVVMDGGIGILSSLRQCALFHGLSDHGKALELALTEGTSRHGIGVGHGLGFRQIFLSLLDMYGALRFRSGDHAHVLEGVSPDQKTAQLAQKPYLNGFFAWVCAMTTVPRENLIRTSILDVGPT